MTTIVIRKNQNQSYNGFYCMGHAGFAKGDEPDILCAAVSALTIGTVNALEELAGEKLAATTNDDTGFLKCDFLEPLQERSVFLMDALVFNLENLSKQYGKKYLTVKFEEV